jgi:hypothetical protein
MAARAQADDGAPAAAAVLSVTPQLLDDAAAQPHKEPSGWLYGAGANVNGVLTVRPSALDSDGDCRHFARVAMPPGAPRMVQVACEYSIAVARDEYGGVWVWGRAATADQPSRVAWPSSHDDVADATARARFEPRCTSVAAASSFAVAVLDNGSVMCVGDKAPGASVSSRPHHRASQHLVKGPGGKSAAFAPRITQLSFKVDGSGTDVGTPPLPVAVDASNKTVLVQTADGGLWACGDSLTSGLGRATRECVLERVHDETGEPMNGVVAFSVGSIHAAAVRDDGTVWVWGNGVSGNHGLGRRIKEVLLPRKAPGFGRRDVDDATTQVAHAVSVGCTKGSPNPKQIQTKDGWLAGQEGPRTHVVDAAGGLWIAGTSHKGLAADHLVKTLSPAVDHLDFYHVGGPAVIDKGAPRVYIGAAEMLRTDPAVASRRMGMTSPEDFGRGADHTTGYLSAVRVVHSVPSHIHSMALTDDGRLFTWGCGSNGRCGLDAIVQIHGGKKRTMKCYVHCPSEIESLEGKRVVSAAVGKWWTWAIVDE